MQCPQCKEQLRCTTRGKFIEFSCTGKDCNYIAKMPYSKATEFIQRMCSNEKVRMIKPIKE